MMRITSLAFLDIIIVDVRQGNPPGESLVQSLCQYLVCGSVNCIGVVSFGIGMVWYKCLDITMWYCMDWYNIGLPLAVCFTASW